MEEDDDVNNNNNNQSVSNVPKLSIEINIICDGNKFEDKSIFFTFEPERPIEHMINHLNNKLEKLIIKNAFCSLDLQIFFSSEFCSMNRYDLYKEVNEKNLEFILSTICAHDNVKKLLDAEGNKKFTFYCRLPERVIVYREKCSEVSAMQTSGTTIFYDNPRMLRIIPIEEFDEANKRYKTDTMIARLTPALFHLYASIVLIVFKNKGFKNSSVLLDLGVTNTKFTIMRFHSNLVAKDQSLRSQWLLESQKHDVRKTMTDKHENKLSKEAITEMVNDRTVSQGNV